ncbi:sulfite reductase subunit alpha [Sediminivirga luteola]|uniref:sulfite reductase subunit alpha n=1 Tax=Sediminivirga luteola TaxID=1774748 RepID=UPI001F5AF87B|nr:sulfite reductase subunit alpha [Sediminivirga luteola]MCI2265264.1 sulfite reductase subunit alpha [Sediminivirga luteola]
MSVIHPETLPQDVPFTESQRVWLAGYLAGLALAAEDDNTPVPQMTVQVLYGSQTGNAETLAEEFASALGESGVGAQVRSLDQITPDELPGMGHVIVICSTYGEGEMPDNAELFWDALAAEGVPRLEDLKFGVIALGDSSYDDFCQAGKVLDTRFEQLGATRLLPRVDCDVDYEAEAAEFTARAVELLAAEAPEGASGAPVPQQAAPKKKRSKWNRKNPYRATLAHNRVLSGPGSLKEIRHIEIALGDSGIEYAAGDALAVLPQNDPALVAEFIDVAGLDPEMVVDGEPLTEVLRTSYEIRTPAKELLARLADSEPHGELDSLLDSGDRLALDNWLWGKDTVDLLRAHPRAELSPDELLSMLKPLAHRAYSISSSPLSSPDRIHLTIAAVRHRSESREYGGVASTMLADRVGESDEVGIFLQPNAAFRVPEDDELPMIMVGPGTGIAPFRAFLAEREGRGANGRNWLFFGDQHRSCDFIYEDELTAWSQAGVLHRLDLAFSRDQVQKVYVQDRMRENGRDLYAWLEEGAHFYVCGDATRMAKDVEQALIDVVQVHGGKTADQAVEYVNELKRAKRYVRDVY